MTSKEKAKQLYDLMGMTTKSKNDAKVACLIVCDEILNTKNFDSVLSRDLVDFQNAYWKYVMEEIHNI